MITREKEYTSMNMRCVRLLTTGSYAVKAVASAGASGVVELGKDAENIILVKLLNVE